MIDVVLSELLLREFERFAEFNCNFLLLSEDELVVLHVFFSVHFQVRSQLVQVQAVLVRALLATEEKLTEFSRSERSPDHPFIQNELVYTQDGDRTFSS